MNLAISTATPAPTHKPCNVFFLIRSSNGCKEVKINYVCTIKIVGRYDDSVYGVCVCATFFSYVLFLHFVFAFLTVPSYRCSMKSIQGIYRRHRICFFFFSLCTISMVVVYLLPSSGFRVFFSLPSFIVLKIDFSEFINITRDLNYELTLPQFNAMYLLGTGCR